MERPIAHAEPAPLLSAHQFQRILLAACIILTPLSLTLYVRAWPENPAPVVFNSPQAAPITTSALAGPLGKLRDLRVADMAPIEGLDTRYELRQSAGQRRRDVGRGLLKRAAAARSGTGLPFLDKLFRAACRRHRPGRER